MNRRKFLSTSSVAVAGASVAMQAASAQTAPQHSFKLKYAPHPGMFRNLGGEDVIDQIKFAADQGFTAWEYNGLSGETPEKQEAIGKALVDLNMTMGVFVAYGSFDTPTFAVKHEDTWNMIVETMRQSVEVAKRVNAQWCTVVPGSVDQQVPVEGKKWNKYGGPRLSEGYQTANVIELLKRCSEVLEPSGLIMVLESLNWHTNHGGTFLQYSDQAYAICKAVGSPSCKMLFDIYHQQITEGNVIPNIDMCWEEIGYLQIGDNPGRKEPGTGEINYKNIFKHLYGKGYEGVLGMEHGNSIKGAEGEQAVIDAYVAADSFEA